MAPSERAAARARARTSRAGAAAPRQAARPGDRVEVVGQVRELHRAGDRVLRDALDEGPVVLTVALGEGLDRCDDALVQTALAELVQRDAGVLNDVVQHGGEALAISTDAKCHAERVEDVRLTGLIALAAVTLRREGNRILDRHDPLTCMGWPSAVRTCRLGPAPTKRTSSRLLRARAIR